MSHILALGGDIFALMIMWRARKWLSPRRHGMFETDTDVKMRRVGGVIVIVICLFSIYANHYIFDF